MDELTSIQARLAACDSIEKVLSWLWDERLYGKSKAQFDGPTFNAALQRAYELGRQFGIQQERAMQELSDIGQELERALPLTPTKEK